MVGGFSDYLELTKQIQDSQGYRSQGFSINSKGKLVQIFKAEPTLEESLDQYLEKDSPFRNVNRIELLLYKADLLPRFSCAIAGSAAVLVHAQRLGIYSVKNDDVDLVTTPEKFLETCRILGATVVSPTFARAGKYINDQNKIAYAIEISSQWLNMTPEEHAQMIANAATIDKTPLRVISPEDSLDWYTKNGREKDITNERVKTLTGIMDRQGLLLTLRRNHSIWDYVMPD